MVEHFSKWIELVALPDKASEGVAYAFLDRVLSHFGAPAEVLTDQGTEFQVVKHPWLRFHRIFFRRITPAAFENLAIAQHKDMLRYATIREEGYRPSIRKFRVGDYVTADCTDYVGCDGRTHYLASARGVTF
ncbi:hypothetical protein AXG93_3617s1050 [Marchantia polymorpha subsp. ruderalis]|uniref:Integrase catalytic domain-containing protein n=1 Tax=Marchantia polymorpha subsp. ruderalis TaxID=1480154 RepID=A0A176WG97_MARPO|nr:hypothetical protein AXG93_3617s1050 [Marchantia polymorpha subsp. ruderalis]